MKMPTIGLQPTALATSNAQPSYPCAAVAPAPRRAWLESWRRVDVAAHLEHPSTSYAASAAHWQCHSRTATQRCVAVSVLSAAEGHSHPQPSHPSVCAGKVGVVIVDHGSRKKASNDMLVEFGDLYGRITGQEIVEIAHMEIAVPTIDEAVDRCVARGARTVVVAPYFLSRGRHIQEDIPALVCQAQARHPGLRCVIAEPIGIDALLVQLISNRVSAALAEMETEGGRRETVMGMGAAVGPRAADAA